MDEDRLLFEQLRSAGLSGGKEFDSLLSKHRPRLRLLVQLRMHRRLQGRVDPSDVLQEAFLDAVRRADDFLENTQMSFFVWLRYLTLWRLGIIHKHHLGIQSRDPRREIGLFQGQLPQASSAALARMLVGRETSPSHGAQQSERRVRLEDALNRISPVDREMLLLRHFEELTNQEAADVLEINRTAAHNRYLRALKRLRELLLEIYGSAAEDKL